MNEELYKKCQEYIPSERDKDLMIYCEYYVKDIRDRVCKGWVTEIGTIGSGQRSIYKVVNSKGMIRSPYGNGYTEGWFYMSGMYDNKTDCQNDTHYMFDGWENLRDAQESEHI